MLFDDVSVLQEHAKYGKSDSIFHDENDSQVERLYNSSPPLLEQIPMYEMDSIFGVDEQDIRDGQNTEESSAITRLNAEDTPPGNMTATYTSTRKAIRPAPEDRTAPTSLSPVPELNGKKALDVRGTRVINDNEDVMESTKSAHDGEIEGETSRTVSRPPSERQRPRQGSIARGRTVSALTQALANTNLTNARNMRLAIYLPDRTLLRIDLDDSCTFGAAIIHILDLHREKGLHPQLVYHKPHLYQICMHEGDGEPDRDFVFDKAKKVRDVYNPMRPNVNEYCLCEKDVEPESRERLGTFSSSDLSESEDSEIESIDSRNKNRTDTVLVTIPSAPSVGNLYFPFTETTRLRDLLPMIAQKHKIQIFTEQYSFVISAEDQSRLKLMSNTVDTNKLINTVGTRKFALQKRVFQDANKVQGIKRRPVANAGGGGVVAGMGAGVVTGVGALAQAALANTELLNSKHSEYQEWHVIKKNNLGRKQERMLGIDNEKIYNFKRGEKRGSSDVKHPDRDISTVLKVESVANDNRSIKIYFADVHIYDIEYTCDTEADKKAVLAKLQAVMARQKAG